MQSTLRELAKEEKMASMALMMLDARCPLSSRNPQLEDIFSRKGLIYLLNKTDLASVRITRSWLDCFKSQGLDIMAVSCRAGSGRKQLLNLIRQRKSAYEEKQVQRSRGSNFRLVVVGIPNTGKSSLINMLALGRSVKTGKKPGLTRGRQWLKVSGGVEILDSPGVMVPRMDMEDTPWILGAVGSIRQEVLPLEEVASRLINFLRVRDLMPGDLFENPKLGTPMDLLEQLARSRGYLGPGGEPDTVRGAVQFLKLFREGRMGRISLEEPPSGDMTGD